MGSLVRFARAAMSGAARAAPGASAAAPLFAAPRAIAPAPPSSFASAAAAAVRRAASSEAATAAPKAAEAAAPVAEAASSGGLFASFAAFGIKHPFANNVILATGRASLADLACQAGIEKRGMDEIDWRRNLVFVLFGGVYLGGCQYLLYVNMYRRWFPTMDAFAAKSLAAKLKDTPGMIDAGKQIAFDVLVHLPFMYLPAFYITKECAYSSALAGETNPVALVGDGLKKYSRNLMEDVPPLMSFWLPADFVVFTVPVWLRMPTRHLVSLLWTAYLSFIRGGADPDDRARWRALTTNRGNGLSRYVTAKDLEATS